MWNFFSVCKKTKTLSSCCPPLLSSSFLSQACRTASFRPGATRASHRAHWTLLMSMPSCADSHAGRHCCWTSRPVPYRPTGPIRSSPTQTWAKTVRLASLQLRGEWECFPLVKRKRKAIYWRRSRWNIKLCTLCSANSSTCVLCSSASFHDYWPPLKIAHRPLRDLPLYLSNCMPGLWMWLSCSRLHRVTQWRQDLS